VPGQAEERAVVGRGYGAEPVEGLGGPVPGGRGPGARVQRKQDGQAQLAQLVQHSPQAFGVIGIFRAVDRGQDVLPGLDAEPGRDLPGRGLVGQHAESSLHDRVARDLDLSGRDALGS
jgi:hypothetical protein